MIPGLQIREAWGLARAAGLWSLRVRLLLVLYFALTALGAAFDGLGIYLVVELIAGAPAPGAFASSGLAALLGWFGLRLPGSHNQLVLLVIALFSAKALVYLVTLTADGAFIAYARKRIQETVFGRVVNGRWEELRGLRTGSALGALTEETQLAVRYLVSAVKTIYFLLASLVLLALALSVNVQMTLLLGLVAAPAFVFLRWFFGLQSRLSRVQAQCRQRLSADLGERLGNLLLIKASGDASTHVSAGLREQPQIVRLELILGFCQAVVSNFNTLLILLAVGALAAWSALLGEPLVQHIPTLAGVGAIGARAAGYVSGAITAFGNLSRFSGSLAPVIALLHTTPDPARARLSKPLQGIVLDNVSYRYEDRLVLDGVSAFAGIGHPLVIRGPSGSGKTTLVNLVAGIIPPHAGRVLYATAEGEKGDSRDCRVRTGYVTQDIALFHGSVRDNLAAAPGMGDVDLWRALDACGAREFVERLGGLDGVMAEAGRDLSGGERRRIAIARALCSRPDALILDEITTGLDVDRRNEILELVERLASGVVVIAITHDEGEYSGWRALSLCPSEQQGATVA